MFLPSEEALVTIFGSPGGRGISLLPYSTGALGSKRGILGRSPAGGFVAWMEIGAQIVPGAEQYRAPCARTLSRDDGVTRNFLALRGERTPVVVPATAPPFRLLANAKQGVGWLNGRSNVA